jgi:hypothetical protein
LQGEVHRDQAAGADQQLEIETLWLTAAGAFDRLPGVRHHCRGMCERAGLVYTSANHVLVTEITDLQR